MVERLGDGLGDPSALEGVLNDPESLLADLVSPEQRHISNALTALTTSIGAYVDHVTAGIAGTLTSSPAALREAWYRYRVEDTKGEQAFAGLFELLQPVCAPSKQPAHCTDRDSHHSEQH